MLTGLTINLAPEQLLSLMQACLRDPKAVATLQPLAEKLALGTRRAEIEQRTYHMGAKATAGLDYDDRLPVRLGCCPSTAYGYLELWERGDSAGLQHTRLGKKYLTNECAVRAFLGLPSPALAA